MIKNWLLLLKQIGRRIKEMASLLLALGSLMIPLAVVLRVEMNNRVESGIIFFAGMGCFIFALINTNREAAQDRKEKIFFAKQLIRTNDLLVALLTEIKGIR